MTEELKPCGKCKWTPQVVGIECFGERQGVTVFAVICDCDEGKVEFYASRASAIEARRDMNAKLTIEFDGHSWEAYGKEYVGNAGLFFNFFRRSDEGPVLLSLPASFVEELKSQRIESQDPK